MGADVRERLLARGRSKGTTCFLSLVMNSLDSEDEIANGSDTDDER
jgi:hypothetical protein